MFKAIKDVVLGGNSSSIADKFNSAEFKDVDIDLSVLNKTTERGKVLTVDKLNKVLEECKRQHPDMAFDKYSIEKRRKLLQRVEWQIRNYKKQVKHWEREQAEFLAVEHLDRLVMDLHSEAKLNTTFKANGMLGGRPTKRSRENLVAAEDATCNKRPTTEDHHLQRRLQHLHRP